MSSAAFVGLLAVGLAGCRADGSAADESAAGDAPLPRDPSTAETDVAATASDSLRLWLDLPDTVGLGESVPISLGVENVGDRSLDLYLRGRTSAFDLIVADARGTVVWRHLEGAVLPAILRIETLPPGESLELEAAWNQRSNEGVAVEPGSYTVRGELLTEGEPLTTPAVPLRITPNR